MKHITIIVPEGQNNLSSIVGAYKIFTRANAYWKDNGNREAFKIELAGIRTKQFRWSYLRYAYTIRILS